nr:asparagine synthase C-terminal domain-containing protein [Hankyongella ginsenosidimutans]
MRRNIGKLPSGLRRMLARAMQSPQLGTVLGAVNTLLPARVRQAAVADRLPKLASLLEADTDDALYRQLVSHWSQPEQLVIGGREPGTLIASTPFPQLDFAHRMMAMDTLTYLPDDILVKVDRASMAVSLEARVPFLDHRVAEFAWQMQLDAKINGNTGKLPLRRLLYRHVPQSIVDRPKMGFGVPVEAWLKGPLKHWAEDLLDPRRIKAQGIFEPDIITRYWQEHQQGRRRWHNHLWDVLMFQAWWDAQYSAS